MEDKYKNIIKKFKTNKGYLNTREYQENGIHRRDITYLVNKNILLKIKRGLYRLYSDIDVSNIDFIDVRYGNPDGVICLLSALAYYELTTFVPSKVWVAVLRNTRKKKIDYPPVEYVTFLKEFFEYDIKIVKEGNYKFKIYSIEKTICDCLRYRNRVVGEDIIKESLREYLKSKNRNLNKLSLYAYKLQVNNILEAWLKPMV